MRNILKTLLVDMTMNTKLYVTINISHAETTLYSFLADELWESNAMLKFTLIINQGRNTDKILITTQNIISINFEENIKSNQKDWWIILFFKIKEFFSNVNWNALLYKIYPKDPQRWTKSNATVNPDTRGSTSKREKRYEYQIKHKNKWTWNFWR